MNDKNLHNDTFEDFYKSAFDEAEMEIPAGLTNSLMDQINPPKTPTKLSDKIGASKLYRFLQASLLLNLVTVSVVAYYLTNDSTSTIDIKTPVNEIIIEQKDNTDYLKKILNQKKINYKIIISKLTNISAKRNLGSKQYDSEYLAFIDSDAYAINSWLDIGLKYFETEKIIVLGGPSGIPFKDEEEKYLLSNYAKRSFFCTANLKSLEVFNPI